MFFVLSKILTILTIPSHLLFFLAVVGVVLLATRFRKAGLRLLVATVLIRAAIWLLPIGHAHAARDRSIPSSRLSSGALSRPLPVRGLAGIMEARLGEHGGNRRGGA
jgi:hypothetical protein